MVKQSQNSDELNSNSTSDTNTSDTNLAHHEFIDISDHTLPKNLRLLSPKAFQHVFEKAEKFANRHWTLIVRPNQLDYPRMGLAIAKKALAKAVWRNRVKRLAREAFRKHKKLLCGYDIVVLTRHGVQDVDNATLTRSFEHLIRIIKRSGYKDGKPVAKGNSGKKRIQKTQKD